jgi:hypothetical protein
LQKDLTLSRPSSRRVGSTANVIRSQFFIPSPLPAVHEYVLIFSREILPVIRVKTEPSILPTVSCSKLSYGKREELQIC